MYLFNYKDEDTSYFKGKYCSSKLTFNSNYHYDVLRQGNLDFLISSIKKSNNPYKDKIIKYLKDDNVSYRMNKKYLAINFKRLLEDATKENIDVTIELDSEFDKMSTFLIEKIKDEPLIMNLPFKNYNSSSFFIKEENPPKINEIAFVNQMSIGIERLNRICATIEDEFIVSFIEATFKSPQMLSMINEKGYTLNYQLVYKHFEDANPYAFEPMINEMFNKILVTNFKNNAYYVPKNKYFNIISDKRVSMTDTELKDLLLNITNNVNVKVNNISKSRFQPINNAKLVKMASDKLIKEFSKPAIWDMLKNGELTINKTQIMKDLDPSYDCDLNYLNNIMQVCIDLKEIAFYQEKTKMNDRKSNILDVPTMDF